MCKSKLFAIRKMLSSLCQICLSGKSLQHFPSHLTEVGRLHLTFGLLRWPRWHKWSLLNWQNQVAFEAAQQICYLGTETPSDAISHDKKQTIQSLAFSSFELATGATVTDVCASTAGHSTYKQESRVSATSRPRKLTCVLVSD